MYRIAEKSYLELCRTTKETFETLLGFVIGSEDVCVEEISKETLAAEFLPGKRMPKDSWYILATAIEPFVTEGNVVLASEGAGHTTKITFVFDSEKERWDIVPDRKWFCKTLAGNAGQSRTIFASWRNDVKQFQRIYGG